MWWEELRVSIAVGGVGGGRKKGNKSTGFYGIDT